MCFLCVCISSFVEHVSSHFIARARGDVSIVVVEFLFFELNSARLGIVQPTFMNVLLLGE